MKTLLRIGQRLKQYRKEKGYTVFQVGDMMGLTASSISKYENGKVNNFTLATLSNFAHIYNVPLERLLEDSEDTIPSRVFAIANIINRNTSMTSLFNVIRRFDDVDIDLLVDIAKDVKKHNKSTKNKKPEMS